MKKFVFAAAALGAMLVAGPAQAAQSLITFTGTVGSGFDRGGFFGAVNTNLQGQAFIATYNYDDATTPPSVYVLSNLSGGGVQSSYSGGGFISFGQGHPVGNPLTASLKIAGVSQFFGNNFSSNVASLQDNARTGGDGFGLQALDVFGLSSPISHLLTFGGGSLNRDFLALDFFTKARTIAFPSTGISIRGDADFSDGSNLSPLRLSFDVSTLTIAPFTSAPGVPEPASWALMIAGFGLTGAAMRSRRSVRTTVSFATA